VLDRQRRSRGGGITVRTVRTAWGAIAVQIVYSCHRGSRQIEHIGSAHDDAELELLQAVTRQRLASGQGVLDLARCSAVAGAGRWRSRPPGRCMGNAS
jgi:hypothetical protein